MARNRIGEDKVFGPLAPRGVPLKRPSAQTLGSGPAVRTSESPRFSPSPLQTGNPDLPGQTSVEVAGPQPLTADGEFTGRGGTVPLGDPQFGATGPGTVSTFDNRLAQSRFDEANRIRRGFIDERDARIRQNRLQDLAFNTPATLDNIQQIRGAQALLGKQTDAQAAERAAQIKAQSEGQLTPKQKADIAFKEQEARRKDIRLGVDVEKAKGERAGEIQSRRNQQEKAIRDRVSTSLAAAIGQTEGEGNEANAARLERTNQILVSSAGPGQLPGEKYDAQELGMIARLPDMVNVFKDALQREGGKGIFSDQLGPDASVKDMLNMFAGFEGPGISNLFNIGKTPNVLLNVGGRPGVEDVDHEAFTVGPLPPDVRKRALEVFNFLRTRTPISERLVLKELGPEGAREYWARVTRNAPDDVVAGEVLGK